MMMTRAMTWGLPILLTLSACAASKTQTSERSSESANVKESSKPRTPEASGEPDGPPKTAATSRPSASKEPAEGAARELAEKVVAASGGKEFDQVVQLEFRFLVTSKGEKMFEAWHRWDRANMRDRVQWRNDDGEVVDVLVDLGTKDGWAFVDGEEVKGEEAQSLLDAAHGRWVNDSYWLLMPLKLLDAGVNLSVAADVKFSDEVQAWAKTEKDYQILSVTFDEVGRTPGDHYWLYVDADTHEVAFWEMLLQGKESRSLASWEDYRRVGPLSVAHDHRLQGGDRHIRFEDVEAFGHVQPEDFEKPTD